MFYPNHAHPYRTPFSLREFQTRLLRLIFRLERFRQRREFTVDVPEEQPFLGNFGHLKFIAQAASADPLTVLLLYLSDLRGGLNGSTQH